ncbi:hypothetical protein TBLA_0B03900 [Henningerozyma blattae CBS 6284]|uniref:4'-phosphopantetheinyl transferase domain-containing protein n=1 Tax=Henningerozyma blattae (strain ATCC 34711 / CBS 6284 / DSM 70876 / NBRC 10599 / NRRL Y-10934 / UCD 77-7) TaxID=1071380 RepID=I2GYM6_HENB6|nr:hypothetical protein TBLA_0B03900 [Tetrapisispora blattae CBS 6284]CCH59228.1 hypothetical protein TBLA_0B03900 [Tetrapisispora blattae CBS 6284]
MRGSIQGFSTIYSIGNDVVKLPRISKLLAQYPLDQKNGKLENQITFQRIASKFMHPIEYSNIDKHQNNLVTYIGGIWATKEAIFKALSGFVPKKDLPPAQTIYTGLFYKINSIENGAPFVIFDDTFKSKYPQFQLFYNTYIQDTNLKALLSIAHDGDYLFANSMLVKDKKKI